MSHDPGARELAAPLETPSASLENAIEALGAGLETAHGTETGGPRLPTITRAPITQLLTHYRELLRRVDGIETNDPARNEVFKALRRMEEGLDDLAAAIGLEGEKAQQKADLGANAMERAGTELGRAIGRLT
jgi:hypothetical protein